LGTIVCRWKLRLDDTKDLTDGERGATFTTDGAELDAFSSSLLAGGYSALWYAQPKIFLQPQAYHRPIAEAKLTDRELTPNDLKLSYKQR